LSDGKAFVIHGQPFSTTILEDIPCHLVTRS